MSVRDTWKARVLCSARGGMAIVVPSILAHVSSELQMINLMVACDPPCWDSSRMSLRTPFLCSVAKVNKNGQIVADAIMREVPDGPMRQRNAVLFNRVTDFRDALCRLADDAMLSEDQRVKFFSAAVKWLAADMRQDPTLDPRDPDAKRLTRPDIKPAYPVMH